MTVGAPLGGGADGSAGECGAGAVAIPTVVESCDGEARGAEFFVGEEREIFSDGIAEVVAAGGLEMSVGGAALEGEGDVVVVGRADAGVGPEIGGVPGAVAGGEFALVTVG